MTIFAFIDQYCQDIIAKVKSDRELVDLTGYPYDELLTNKKGQPVPIVYIDGVEVPIRDFFVMTKSDFVDEYRLPSAAESYDNYLENFEIIEGPAALSGLRISLQDEMQRLNEDLVETGVTVSIG